MPKPSAGSGLGYGETITVDGATGGLQFAIPIHVPDARALTPRLSIQYTNSRNNGLFGLGFSLDLPAISRRSNLGIPRYTERDEFVTESGDVLVPRYRRDGTGRWQPVRRHDEQRGERYQVRAYRRRIEAQFDRIECWTRERDGDTFWKVTDRHNITSIYGECADARLADADAPARVFRWMLQEQFDERGNRASYRYRAEQVAGCSSLYPLIIEYGNYRNGEAEQYAFCLRFLYDDGMRPDPQRNFRAGFPVLTRLRCLGCSTTHYFPSELGAEPVEIGRTELDYVETGGYSRLRSLRRTGQRHDANGVVASSLPPVRFDFYPLPDAIAFKPLQSDTLQLPPARPQDAYAFVDLNGDGLAGLLADRNAGRAPLYWAPLGNGGFAPAEALPIAPIAALNQPGRSVLLDMTGTGKRDSLLLSANRAGVYANNNPGWSPYQPLVSNSTTLTLPATLLVDLSGSGRLGLLTSGPAGWQYCESLGRDGFGPPVTTQSPDGMPLYQSDSPAIYVGFLNIFDDGLSHLVEAGSGYLRVWPSLGYGRFAPPVLVPGMPQLPSNLGAANLLFADFTGTGGVDLAVIASDHVDLYLNHYGHAFTYYKTVTLPADFGTRDTVQAADVLGRGVSQLVLNYAGRSARNQYLDVSGSAAPHLLASFDNGMGVRSAFTYRSSVDYFLKDKAGGHPWLTRLPFPATVVARIEQEDAISATRSVQVMQYAEGYFDPGERQFIGFAYSQKQNELAVDEALWHFPCTDRAGYLSQRATADGYGSAPRLQRSWQHVGDWGQMEQMRARMLAGIYSGVRDTLLLPSPLLSPDFSGEPVASLWLAWRALANRAAVSETYGIDEQGLTGTIPYIASQQAWGVSLVQPALDGHSAVVLVSEREAAQSSFDQLPDDPHITHQVQPSFSPYGQALRRLEIGYARKPAQGRKLLPAQLSAQIRLTTFGLINHLDGGYRNASGGTTPPLELDDGLPLHAVGLPFENQSFELGGFAQPDSYYRYDELAALATACLQHLVPFGEPFSGAPDQARLFSWRQAEYWDAAAAAPLQRVGAQLLARCMPQAAFPQGFVARYLGDKIDPTYLRDSGGYRLADDYWWNDGQTSAYAQAEHFYVPVRYTSPFGAGVDIEFDRYCLLMIRKTDPLGFAITADNDYQALAPHRLVDENRNVSEYLFDGLSEVVVSTRFGTEAGQPVGNLPLSDYRVLPTPTVDVLLANPGAYLQGASQYLLYCLDAWEREPRLPVHTVEVYRRSFVHAAAQSDDIGIRLRYLDGSLRELATANLVTGSPPYRMDGPLETASHTRLAASGDDITQWAFSDQHRYDRQGNAIVTYQPYFASLPLYQPRPDAAFWTMRYDALDRLVAGATPDGFLTRTAYAAWSNRYWDQDDTVLDSPYYRSHIHDPNLAPAERAALDMAAAFADTPLTVAQDVFGRSIQDENILVQPNGQRELLCNYRWYDAQDHVVAMADPRFYVPEQPDQPRFYNYFVQYDMQGHPVWQKSADAGNTPLAARSDGLAWRRLYDVTGGLIDEWDRRGIRHHTSYNVLRQPLSQQWSSEGLDCLALTYAYGDDPDNNTVNRPVLQCDQGGMQRTTLYSLLGDAVLQSRQFVASYQGLTDWRAEPAMLPTIWQWQNRQNGRGEPTGYTAPNGAMLQVTLTRNGWPRALALTLAGQDEAARLATVTSFTPQGTAQVLSLANGASIEHSYDDKALRLRRIATRVGATLVQDIGYTYDPVGNVTNLENGTPPPGSPAPTVDYPARYDSIYQLVSASGLREADGVLTRYRRSYHYDHAANLLRVEDDAGLPYSSQFRLAASANHAITEAMSGDPDQFYDADGYLTTLPDQTRLHTDPAGCLHRVTAADGATTFAQYADNRSRLRKVDLPAGGAPRETFYLQPFSAQGDPSAAASLVLHLGGGMVGSADFAPGAQGRSAQVQYQCTDRLNSVVMRLDDQGRVIDRQEFYPYGETALLIADTVPAQRRYQYTGKEKDPATGLYSFPERYFAPALCRWIAPDPAGTVDGSNLFAYARCNPLTLNDPTGECGHPPQKQSHPFWKGYQGATGKFRDFGLTGNLVGEILSGGLKLHHPIFELMDKSKVLTAASTIQLANIAGISGFFGGSAGIIYHSLNMKKYGVNRYDASSIVGNSLFAYEGYSIIKALTLSGHHELEGAHRRIGRIGMAADIFKIPYYAHNGEWSKVGLYTGLAFGNWRASVTPEVAHNFYYKLMSWTIAPYNALASGRGYVQVSKESIVRAASTGVKVQSWQILLGTAVIYGVRSNFQKQQDKH